MRVEVKRIHNLETGSNLKAFADVMLDGVNIVIKGCKVVQGSNGLFVSLPSTKKGEKYYPIVTMPVRDQYDVLQTVVLEAYDEKGPAQVDSQPQEQKQDLPPAQESGDGLFGQDDGSAPF